MTTFDEFLKNAKPIKGFSTLKMKREIQAEVDREIAGMSVEEIIAYTREASRRFRESLNNPDVQEVSSPVTAEPVTEEPVAAESVAQ